MRDDGTYRWSVHTELGRANINSLSNTVHWLASKCWEFKNLQKFYWYKHGRKSIHLPHYLWKIYLFSYKFLSSVYPFTSSSCFFGLSFSPVISLFLWIPSTFLCGSASFFKLQVPLFIVASVFMPPSSSFSYPLFIWYIRTMTSILSRTFVSIFIPLHYHDFSNLLCASIILLISTVFTGKKETLSSLQNSGTLWKISLLAAGSRAF